MQGSVRCTEKVRSRYFSIGKKCKRWKYDKNERKKVALEVLMKKQVQGREKP